LSAITEALTIGCSLDEIWMISLGTCRPVHDLSHKQQDKIGEASRDWGFVVWVANGLLDVS